ncbi:hypothetical protein D1872_260810 [compost metagenome]
MERPECFPSGSYAKGSGYRITRRIGTGGTRDVDHGLHQYQSKGEKQTSDVSGGSEHHDKCAERKIEYGSGNPEDTRCP